MCSGSGSVIKDQSNDDGASKEPTNPPRSQIYTQFHWLLWGTINPSDLGSLLLIQITSKQYTLNVVLYDRQHVCNPLYHELLRHVLPFTYPQEYLATAKRCQIKCQVLDLESFSQQQKLDTLKALLLPPTQQKLPAKKRPASKTWSLLLEAKFFKIHFQFLI